jgi:quercetin dioxygenase-like cupin family protein
LSLGIRPFRAPWRGPASVRGLRRRRRPRACPREDFFVAQLRFSEHATIQEHPGEHDTIVVCLEGEGFTSVADATAPLVEGQQARWPKGVTHRLWTENSTMTTIMVERHEPKRQFVPYYFGPDVRA